MREQGAWTEVAQRLANGPHAVALFVEVQLVDEASGEPVLPVLWDDNYVSLVPGESLALTARVRTEAVAGRTLGTRVTGWNLGAAGHPDPTGPTRLGDPAAKSGPGR